MGCSEQKLCMHFTSLLHQVKDLAGTSWRGCETRCRLEKLKNSFVERGVDPLVALLTSCYDDYQNVLNHFPDEKLHDTFEQQLSDFAEILLDEDNTGTKNSLCQSKSG